MSSIEIDIKTNDEKVYSIDGGKVIASRENNTGIDIKTNDDGKVMASRENNIGIDVKTNDETNEEKVGSIGEAEVMALGENDVGMDRQTFIERVATLLQPLPNVAPPAVAHAGGVHRVRSRRCRLLINLLRLLGYVSAIVLLVGSWLLQFGVSISAMVRRTPCEKDLSIWLFINAMAPIISVVAHKLVEYYPNSSRARMFQLVVAIGHVMSTISGAVLTYSIPFNSSKRSCPDWLYYSSFISATLALVYTTITCCLCIGVIRHLTIQPNLRNIRHAVEYNATINIINQPAVVEQIRDKILLPKMNNDQRKEQQKELSLRVKLCPQFRALSKADCHQMVDPCRDWHQLIYLWCFNNTCPELSQIVITYLRELVWAISAKESIENGSYEVSTYDPFTGTLTAIPVSLAPPLRFNAVVRALPQNGLIMVMGGIKQIAVKKAGLLNESRKGELHIIQRVDIFNVCSRQWEGCEPLTLTEGPLFQHYRLDDHDGTDDEQHMWHAAGRPQPIVDAVVMHAFNKQDESLIVLGPTETSTNVRQCRWFSVEERKWLPQTNVPGSPFLSSLAAHKETPGEIYSFGCSGPSGDHHQYLQLGQALPQFSSFTLSSPQQQLLQQLSILNSNNINNSNNNNTDSKVDVKIDVKSETKDRFGWKRLENMHLGRFQPTVCCVDDGFVVAGGEIEQINQFPVATVEAYSFTTKKWRKLPKLPCMMFPPQAIPSSANISFAVVTDCTKPQLGTLYHSLHYLPFQFTLPINRQYEKEPKEWNHLETDAFDFAHYKQLLFSALLTM